MVQRKMLFIGIVLIVSGCLSWLYFALILDDPIITGVSRSADGSQAFKNLQCPPRIVTINESGNLSVSISNPFDQENRYSFTVKMYDAGILQVEDKQDRIIPGNQTLDFNWPVTFLNAGDLYIRISAIGESGAGNSDGFPNWPQSFVAGCGILVRPYSDQPVKLLGFLSILTGAGILFPAIRKSLQNHRFREDFQPILLFLGMCFILIGIILFLFGASIIHPNVFYHPSYYPGPDQHFVNMQCAPGEVKINETSLVTATIANPINETLQYSIFIEEFVYPFKPTHSVLDKLVLADQTVDIVWPVTPTTSRDILVYISARSDKDKNIPGLLHNWPTSFVGSCWIRVLGASKNTHPTNWGNISLGIGIVLILPAVLSGIRRRIFLRK